MLEKKFETSFMTQKFIIDKANGAISEYIVLSDAGFVVNDWLFKPKFFDMVSKIGDAPVELQLKRTNKGSVDEGKTPQEGKALRLSVSGDSVTIGVYTQVYGKPWTESHTHTIGRGLFDAYAFVVQNDFAVALAEKAQKAPENFTLNLG